MRKINKIINITLIFMLIGVVARPESAYPDLQHSLLRPALQFNRLSRGSIDAQDASVETLSVVAMFPGVTIFEVKVDGKEYEISKIGVKIIRQRDLTSRKIYDKERCIRIARAVNKIEPKLGETALKEEWAWWKPFYKGCMDKGSFVIPPQLRGQLPDEKVVLRLVNKDLILILGLEYEKWLKAVKKYAPSVPASLTSDSLALYERMAYGSAYSAQIGKDDRVHIPKDLLSQTNFKARSDVIIIDAGYCIEIKPASSLLITPADIRTGL